MSSYPVIRLKQNRDRSVRNKHPWLFSGAVHSFGNLKEGMIVEIQSFEGESLAWGHWAGKSSIVCRMFEFQNIADFNTEDYWFHKLRQAHGLRSAFIHHSDTNMYRMVNAEGDHLPGLIIDRYPDTAVLQLRTQGMRNLQSVILKFLHEELNIKNILQKDDKTDQNKPLTKWLAGQAQELIALENGLKFHVNPETGQKTGFFLDQRSSRNFAKTYAKDKTVLNTFAYTGGFSVYALQGGAKEVVSVDISESVITLAEENVKLNFGSSASHEGIVADCFEYLRHAREDTYDMIILDPPAFTKHADTVQQASRGYKDINLKAMRVIRSGGMLLTFSCSQHISTDLFRKIVFAAAADSGRNVQIVAQFTHAPDHPINIYHPEGEYLKGLALIVN